MFDFELEMSEAMDVDWEREGATATGRVSGVGAGGESTLNEKVRRGWRGLIWCDGGVRSTPHAPKGAHALASAIPTS